MQDWRERGGGSGESVFHSERRGGGRGTPGMGATQPLKPKPKSVTFGENRISVFLRDPTTIAQASQQGRVIFSAVVHFDIPNVKGIYANLM